MIEIDPKITQIPGFDQDCLWFLYKMTQVKMSYQNTHPKLATLEKWTGWEKKKVLRVAEKLEKMGVLKIEKRWKKGGGQSSNEYTITTKHIFYKTNAEGASLTDSEAEKDHEYQNGTLAREHESQKRHGDESQKGTHNIKYSNSLNPTTYQEAREEFLNFELDDQRRIFAKTTFGLTDEEIEITLLDFKDEPKYRQNPPTNPAKTFMNWLRNVGLDKLAQNHRKQAPPPQKPEPTVNYDINAIHL